MDKFSYVGNGDVNAIDNLYQEYLKDPNAVDQEWKKFFEGIEFAQTNFEDSGEIPENFQKEFKVLNLIEGYRNRGHLFTRTNPVRERRKYEPSLDISNFGLEASDMDVVFKAGAETGIGPATLKDIIAHLEETYCQSIGIEYNYIRQPERLNWLREKIEVKNRPVYDAKEKQRIYQKLNDATGFEQFLQKKFVGQKRFSVEGGEALIAGLDKLVRKGAYEGIEEFIIGMAHRGRLNTLANIFDKKASEIFTEFEGKEFDSDDSFDGDVKYHLGHSQHVKFDNNAECHMTLAPNPSHLEAVAPVVQGIARAKLDLYLENDENKIVPIIVHGDAAVAGQGIAYEVVQMAQLDAYRAGGTIHIVVNNQVGFTTNYLDARSSTYCTDVAKTTLCPVFHVNGDDVEAMVQTMEIALEYRQKFHRDVFIDILCYRKYGHNEGDEPKFTQPKLYKAIQKHPNPRDIYLNQLVKEGVLTAADGKKMESELNDYLQKAFDDSKKQDKSHVVNFLETTWKDIRYANQDDFKSNPKTGVDIKKLADLGNKLATLPEGKNYFRKIKKLFDDRKNQIETNSLDWGTAEMLAYATLLTEGFPVRLTGQDVERGTFSHRHAVVKTEDTEEEIITLNLLDKGQSQYDIYNSLLSEYGVLGFEYGYSLANPYGMTMWEAQFGDFFNGAQIMVDQFIAAGEDKWKVHSGLVMLLPHGYEGMGAEHSSARIERWLQLSGDLNWQVCNCTTPANYFHLLRRQMHRDFRKPLVVFTPKMLLRYPKCTSTLEELAKGSFQNIIDDPNVSKKDGVKKVILCSGKIYYDMIEEVEKRGIKDVALIRLEQMYPFPKEELMNTIQSYKNAEDVIWAQEEPENMGAWTFILSNLRRDVDIDVVARPSSSCPAEGSSQKHASNVVKLMDSIFESKAVLAK